MKDELLNVCRILLIRLVAMACYGKAYLSLFNLIIFLDELRVRTISGRPFYIPTTLAPPRNLHPLPFTHK